MSRHQRELHFPNIMYEVPHEGLCSHSQRRGVSGCLGYDPEHQMTGPPEGPPRGHAPARSRGSHANGDQVKLGYNGA